MEQGYKQAKQQMTSIWPVLQAGDVVDIISPGWKSPEDDCLKAKKAIEAMGYQPRMQAIDQAHPLFSDTDDARFLALKNALYAEDSKVIWCMQGGYGSARLMPELMKLEPPQEPKCVIGFSDITVLHLFLNQRWGWPTLHGPVLAHVGNGRTAQKEVQELQQILSGDKQDFTFNSLQPLNEAAQQEGSVSAEVIGGNLSLVETSIGTDWECKPEGKILFIEEYDERAYRVDRLFVHLQQAGMLESVKAILLGDIVNHHPEENELLQQVIQEFAAQRNIPVLHFKDVGHGKINHAFPLNVSMDLVLGENASLSILG